MKELGIQNQAMSFQEMANASREKRAPMVQPPAPPVIPAMNPNIMPEPIALPAQARVQIPSVMNMNMQAVPQVPQAPMLPFAEQQAIASSEPAKCDAKPKGGFCMDSYQKEMLALALIASVMSSPMAQDKLAEISYFQNNRVLRAVASGVAVAIVFTVIKKFVF